MKRVVILLIILSISFYIFASDDGYGLLGETTKVITAFKALASSSEIAGDTYVNIAIYEGATGNTTSSVYEGMDISIPENYRNTAYSAFNWVLTGNYFKQISLAFEFGPMVLTDDTSKYIPYSVSLSTTDTKVGSVTANSNNSTKTAYRYGNTTVYLRYRDSISKTNPGDITTSSKTGTVTYDMSTNTNAYKNYYDKKTTTYSRSDCGEWERKGAAVVTLKIRNVGNNVQYTTGSTVLGNGKYVANVVITVTIT